MDSSQIIPGLAVILLAASVIYNVLQSLSLRKLSRLSNDVINDLRARCSDTEKAAMESERARQAERMRMENEQHELLKLERAKAYDEGRELGRVEQRKEHIEELTRLHQECARKISEEVEKVATETRDKVRTEYELQSKMFSVQISPYVQITEDKGLIKSSFATEVGYQYQLLVNGIPVFQPHVITERSEIRKEVSPERVKELATHATELATKAIETYLSGGGRAFAKLAPAIVKQLAGK